MRFSAASLLLAFAVLAACGQPSPAAGEGATAAAAAATAPAQAAAPLTEEQTQQIAAGRDIAVRNCAGCHALDDDTQSPRADAPPMRDLLARYDSEALADDLIEGIKLGHEDMPQFDFSVLAADALVAYLRSIRPAPSAGSE